MSFISRNTVKLQFTQFALIHHKVTIVQELMADDVNIIGNLYWYEMRLFQINYNCSYPHSELKLINVKIFEIMGNTNNVEPEQSAQS